MRKIIEMHGGRVNAHSEGPGSGSEFCVRLPAAEAPVRDAERRTEPGSVVTAASGACRRVLVVDDNVDAAQGLARLLLRRGCEVATVHDGPAALDEASRFHPDVVLLDIGLPGLDGYEVARRLRSNGARHALMLAVSGYGTDDDRQKSQEAGFDQHLLKPVDFDAVWTAITAQNAMRSTSGERIANAGNQTRS